MSADSARALIVLVSAIAVAMIGSFPSLLDLWGVGDWIEWWAGAPLFFWPLACSYLDATWLLPIRLGRRRVPYQKIVTAYRWEIDDAK